MKPENLNTLSRAMAILGPDLKNMRGVMKDIESNIKVGKRGIVEVPDDKFAAMFSMCTLLLFEAVDAGMVSFAEIEAAYIDLHDEENDHE